MTMSSCQAWTPREWLFVFGVTAVILFVFRFAGGTDLPTGTLIMYAMGGAGFAHFYELVMEA